jgi:hypothetical protein
MKPLTKDQYQFIKDNYADALILAKQSMLSNGIDELIPLYEELTGEPFNYNCTDCRLDMMILLCISVSAYELTSLVEQPIIKKKDAKA